MRPIWSLGILALALAGCATVPEPAPDGLRCLERASSLPALRARAGADLSWTDPDGAAIFLWISPAQADGQRAFVLDQAWQLTNQGRTWWCFIDPTSGAGQAFHEPLPQFLALKHLRERIPFPTERHDGNQSFAERLSQRGDGAEVFKLVYCSSSGPRAHQEGIRTYLIFIGPDGRPQLAARDLGREGGSKSGPIFFQDSLEIEVMWQRGGTPAPFQARIRERQDVGETGEAATLPGYTTFRDGVLRGRFPLHEVINRCEYLEADGTNTLDAVADSLAAYRASWVNAEWVTPEERALVREAWRSELRRLNPEINANAVIPAGTHVVVPDWKFEEASYERVRSRHAAPEKAKARSPPSGAAP